LNSPKIRENNPGMTSAAAATGCKTGAIGCGAGRASGVRTGRGADSSTMGAGWEGVIALTTAS
jgi:hypothetical protein